MRLAAGLVLALLAASGVAEARMHHPYRGHRIVPVATAPLDGFTTPSGAYSFRKLRSAYSGFAVKLQKADTTTQDIGFLGFVPGLGSPIDMAAAAAFCTTTCSVQVWYDQSGNGRNITNGTIANQPVYVPNCIGSLPCVELTLATQVLQSASFTPATGAASINVVANRVSGTAGCVWLRQNAAAGNRLQASSGLANFWAQSATAGGGNVSVLDNAWHSGTGLFNGASSSIAIDGNTATAMSLTNAVGAGAMALVGGATTTCRQFEMVLWDNYLLSAGEVAALVANQRGYGLIP